MLILGHQPRIEVYLQLVVPEPGVQLARKVTTGQDLVAPVDDCGVKVLRRLEIYAGCPHVGAVSEVPQHGAPVRRGHARHPRPSTGSEHCSQKVLDRNPGDGVGSGPMCS